MIESVSTSRAYQLTKLDGKVLIMSINSKFHESTTLIKSSLKKVVGYLEL